MPRKTAAEKTEADEPAERRVYLARRQPGKGGSKGTEVVLEVGLDPDRPGEPVQVRMPDGTTRLLPAEDVTEEPPAGAERGKV